MEGTVRDPTELGIAAAEMLSVRRLRRSAGLSR